MILFHNDYNETCHPVVIERLNASRGMQMPGYGTDIHCAEAARLIREKCENENLAVHFLVGGTQTNLIVIAAALRPHQAVISADSGHVNVHETGAIEATGHKIMPIPSDDGKITAQQVETLYLSQSLSEDVEHIAQPKMVYISNPTENGTTYSCAELTAIHDVCQKYGLYLFVDGARLGYALAAADCDISLAQLARLTDVFYIGGTKVGAMFGEAVVISNPAIADDFRYLMKQRGGMLAKGWLLGVQFQALFENDLYFEISRHANELAERLRKSIRTQGYPLVYENNTNQVFAVLPNTVLSKISNDFTYAVWARHDETHTVVRFCTSWATTDENVEALCDALRLTTDISK